MTRTKLKDRTLPDYTKDEEMLNCATHAIGALFGAAALVMCLMKLLRIGGDAWDFVGCSVYGASLILLYCVSSVYHGLRPPMAKKVMQVVDHCTIYYLIAGTYTPVLLSSIRTVSPAWAWVIFGIVWGLALVATVFTAIDLKKYSVFSMVCYIGMGWCIILAAKTAIRAIPFGGLIYLLFGGIAYTVGAVIYGIGKKQRYMHSLFHLFVLAGSVMQFICIYCYVI